MKKFNFYPLESTEPSQYNPFTEAETLRTCNEMWEWRKAEALAVGESFVGTLGRWERVA